MEEIKDYKFNDRGKDSLSGKKHFHNGCYEILHIISGSGNVMIKDKFYKLQPGYVFFINGYDAHCSVPESAEKYIRNRIVISMDFIDEIIKLTDSKFITDSLFGSGGGVCVEFSSSQSSLINELFLKINEKLWERSYDSKLNIAFSVIKIMNMAVDNRDGYTPPIYNKMSEVLEFINNNIEKKIGLDEICDNLHISKFYLCHTFKKTTNMSIFDYILIMRLAKAKKMLTQTHLSISEIAMQTGFSGFSYFSKKFREKEGVTPLKYRQQFK